MPDPSGPVLVAFFAGLAAHQTALLVLRRDDPRRGWLAATSAVAAIGAATVHSVVGSASAAGSLRERIGASAVVAVAALLLELVGRYLGEPFGRTGRVLQGILATLAIVVPLLPASIWPWAARTALAAVVPAVALLGWRAAAEIRSGAGSGERRMVVGGVTAVVVAGAYELLLRVFALATAGLPAAPSGVPLSAPVPGFVLASLLLALGVALSAGVNRVRSELETLRQRLEQMVEDRTEELSVANRRLEAEISERRLAEEAMRMLERAVEQSADGLMVTDLEGNAQFLNEAWARMHGYQPAEVLGYHLALFHSPEQLHGEVAAALAAVRDSGSFQGEVEHRRKDGSLFPAWTSLTQLRDPEDRPSGYVILARDVTARREAQVEKARLEGRVQRVQKLESLASLAGGIAHDYNNLLTGILGNASLALSELPASSAVRDKIRHIETAAERAVDLTGQLLAYAGEYQLAVRPLQVDEVLRDMMQILGSAISKKAVLQFHLKQGLPEIAADPAQLRQAVLNLVANASDAIQTSGSGVITVRTGVVEADRRYLSETYFDDGRPEGRYVLIGVSDSGVGMDETTRARMFDPFFSTKEEGRGLGLAAVLGIVRSHGGTLKVYSAPGRGTTVELLFPELVAAGGDQALRQSLLDWFSSGTILVVDDEEILRDLSRDILTRQGFEVLTADSGPEAIELFRRRRTDVRLVLLDRTMPRMDGERVFKELRELDPRVPVILMSGYKEREVMEGFAGWASLDGFLQKPFRPDELLAKVRELLEGRRGAGPAPAAS